MQGIIKQKLEFAKQEILQEVFEENESLHYDLRELNRIEKILEDLVTDKTARLVLQDLAAIHNTCCEEKCDLAYKAGIAVATQILGIK